MKYYFEELRKVKAAMLMAFLIGAATSGLLILWACYEGWL